MLPVSSENLIKAGLLLLFFPTDSYEIASAVTDISFAAGFKEKNRQSKLI
jgi:hypothetical protein